MAKTENIFGELGGGGNEVTQIATGTGSVANIATAPYKVIFAREEYSNTLVSEITWIVGVDTTSKTEGWYKTPWSTGTPNSTTSITNNGDGTITISGYTTSTITVYGI